MAKQLWGLCELSRTDLLNREGKNRESGKSTAGNKDLVYIGQLERNMFYENLDWTHCINVNAFFIVVSFVFKNCCNHKDL